MSAVRTRAADPSGMPWALPGRGAWGATAGSRSGSARLHRQSRAPSRPETRRSEHPSESEWELGTASRERDRETGAPAGRAAGHPFPRLKPPPVPPRPLLLHQRPAPYWAAQAPCTHGARLPPQGARPWRAGCTGKPHGEHRKVPSYRPRRPWPCPRALGPGRPGQGRPDGC